MSQNSPHAATTEPMRITVIGTGYVGLVTGTCLAYLGHKVSCIDADPAKIRVLNSGGVPFYEPFVADLLEIVRRRGAIDFRDNMRAAVGESDVVFIAVGTPSRPDGAADLTYLEAAAREIGASLQPRQPLVVINKSTVPVGCGNLVEALIREGFATQQAPSADAAFQVASNPEFLREGSAIHDSLYPDRVVIGSDDPQALATLLHMYLPLLQQAFPAPDFAPRPAGTKSVPVVTTSLTSAEMIKYAANAFLATKISFANEMANICERIGAEATDVMRGIGLDSRIGSRFLNTGIGWGGSCFKKDLLSLTHIASEYGYRARMLEATLAINEEQRLRVIQKLQERLFVLKGRTIGLLGLAFKPDTDDLRDAPSLSIAARLLEMGARVCAYDPVAMTACRQQHPELKIRYCDSPESLASHADALIVVTEWEGFRNLDLASLAGRMTRPILVDGRNAIDAAQAREAGFDYCRIGQGSQRRAHLTLKATA